MFQHRTKTLSAVPPTTKALPVLEHSEGFPFSTMPLVIPKETFSEPWCFLAEWAMTYQGRVRIAFTQPCENQRFTPDENARVCN